MEGVRLRGGREGADGEGEPPVGGEGSGGRPFVVVEGGGNGGDGDDGVRSGLGGAAEVPLAERVELHFRRV